MIRHFEKLELNQYSETYERDGVALLPQAFKKADVDILRAKLWQAFRTAPANHIQWKGTKRLFPALLFAPDGMIEYSRAVSPIVKHFLGDNVSQMNCQAYFRLPGDGDEFGWHQDICFRIPRENFQGVEAGYLQTAIVIDKMDDENGGIEYVLGSHKGPELPLVPRDGSEAGLRSFDRTKFRGTKMNADPGDVLVWSSMIIHGSEKNTSSRYRSYFMNGFCKTECLKHVGTFPHYLKDGALA